MKKYSVRFAKAISLQALEQRLMLDGAAATTLTDVAIPEPTENEVDNALQALPVSNPSEDRNDNFLSDPDRDGATGSSPAEVVFIDTAVVMLQNSDIDDIVDSIAPDVPVYFLDSSSDGITQISQVLSDYSGLDAVHIISHGEQGQLYLGSGVLDSDSMQTDYIVELAALGDALSEQGDILLYGCNFSEGAEGLAATELLSQMTGADVAASVDFTGASDKGGDWDLEVNVGIVERQALSATAFTGLLIDTDGDGVDDADDLDTDNDGILDTDEGYSVPLGTAIDPLSLNSPNYPRWNQLQAPWMSTGDGTTATVPGLFGGLIDFEATLINDGNGGSVSWGQGAQIRSIWTPSAGASIDKFFLQSRDNGTFADDHARYTFDFNSPVQNFSFITGGINESDTVIYEAYYQGVAVPITAANFSNLDAGVSVVNGNTLQGGPGTSGGTSVDQNRGTLTLAGPIDQIVVRAGNGDGSNSNVTLGIHTFNGNLISTAAASTTDTDGDGIDDHLDLDSDNDGISDLQESGADVTLVDGDNDGVYDNTAVPGSQVDSNGVPLAASGGVSPVNADNDSLSDFIDLDSDNDGLPDVVEGQSTNAYVALTGTDSDNDGVDDAWDSTAGHGGNFIGVEDTDSDSSPDYIDADSDGDGVPDVAESGLPLIGADSNNDGIDDSRNATYADPDGDVNTPFTDLQNIDTDLAESDYRSFNDLDCDSIPDHLDADIDGDGILNVDEGFVQDFTGQYNFTHNENNGTATTGTYANNAPDSNLIIASSQSTVVGPGLIELDSNGNPATPGSNYEYNFRGVDTPDLASAIANDDYIELTFSTLPSYTSDQAFLDAIFHGTQNTAGNGTNFTDFDVAIIASDNGFATPGDVLVNSFTVDRDDSSYNFRVIETGLAYELLPGTTYSFRFYFFNDQGVGNFASNGNVDEIGRITVDDTFFSVSGNSALSTGGSVANNSNLDSDNDGISDLRESGNAAAIAADSNNDGLISDVEAAAAGFTDTDGDGAWDQLNVIPVDTDGDGIADYLDPDSDNDGISDLVENQSTSGFQPLSGIDTDGDGVDDVFDDPAALKGGDFGVPEDTDGDGIPDYLDTDSDNDGIPDTDDTDFRVGADSDKDGDGIFDSDDIDDDNDGILDTVESPSLVFLNDRSLFEAALGSNNTVIDSGGAFDVDPVAQAGLASVSRSGTINGDAYAYTVHDVDFSNTPTGTIDPGMAGNDIFDLDNLNIETPAAQSGAVGTGSWGVDSVTGSTSTRNAVVFDFTTTPGNAGIGHFGVDLLDFESSAAGRLAEYRIYYNGTLVDSGVIDFADGSDGNGVSRFWGYAVSTEDQFFDQVVLVLGDDTVGGDGARERWAADNFTFGTAVLEQDGDGIANHCDLDSDNDGISDLYESGASAAIIAADTNNDGTISLAEAAAANGGIADADGDGLMDIFDVDPADPTAVASVGSVPVDTDADGIEDYHDLDSDNDGIPDAVEAQPTLGYQTPSIGTDADSDGIVDTFDDPSIDHGGAFTTPEDTDGDSTPDFRDLDSDNDTLDDTTESGLTPGADTDGDGIADNIAPNSYDDTDGIVSVPVNDLDNLADSDLTEVDYRSVNDKDWDGVPDDQDLDQDGDGILDTDESLSALPDGTLIETVLGGTGITTDAAAWATVLNSLLPGQVALEDFERFAIDTPLDGQNFNGFSIAAENLAGVDREYDIDSTQYGTVPLSGDRQATIHLTRTGGDQVQVTLTLNEPVIGFGINFGDIHDGNGTTTLDIAYDGTLAWSSTDHVGGNGVGVVTDSITGETRTFGNSTFGFIGSYDATSPISEITITYGIGQGDSFTFDDITLIYPNVDTDGDGIPDHCDFDSDNDGISDLIESGDSIAIAADTDLDGVITDAEALAYGLTPNGDGTYAELTYNPVDTDGDGVQDYLDLDSDNDGIPDAVEAQPTSGYQSPSIGADADGDGVVDSFDDPLVEHGGAFTLPVDTDGDGTPDYLDTDSDNDGVDDITESGLVLSGVDADGDGIDDAVAPGSYADTDGIIISPSSDLDNEISDTFEVAYREVPITIGVAKSIVGQPVAQADGSFAVTYEVVVENTGQADLIDVSVIESLAAEFGPAFVSASNLSMSTASSDPASSIAIDTVWNGGSVAEFIDNSSGTLLKVGDSFAVQFVVLVNPTSSALDNQVIARGTGVDHDGNPIVDGTGAPITAIDFSDSGTDADGSNPGEDGDTGGSDDPTPLYLPLIGLAKEAGDAVPNGDYFDVPFTLNWQNNGNVDLANVAILDDIMAQFGGQFAGATIDSVTTSSTATVAANGAWSGNTTQSLITHTGNPLAVGDTIQVVFTVTIDPNAAPASSSGLENSATTSGTGINPTTGAPDTDLVTSDISDNGADPASENGLDEIADGTFANDPTPVALPNISVAKEVFGAPVPLANDNFSVTYQLVVENTGNVDLAGLSLDDNIAAQFGAAFVSAGSLTLVTPPSDPTSNIVLDTGWDGDGATEMIDQTISTLLNVGDSFTVQVVVEVDPDATGTSAPLDNQATVAGDAVDDNGNPLTGSAGVPLVVIDDSDNGADPVTDNGRGTTDDPTPLLIGDLKLGKQANTVEDVAGLSGVFDVNYLVVIENTGTIELENLQITDDITLLTNFGDAYDPTPITGPTDRSGFVAAPVIVGHTLANPADLPNINAGFLGGAGQTTIFDGTSGALQTGEQITVAYTVRIDGSELLNGPDATTASDPGNQVQGSADSAVGPVVDDSDDGLNPNTNNGEGNTDDPTPFEIPQVRLWKEHSDAVNNGDGNSTITVTLRVENSGTVPLSDLSLTEDMASQFGAAFISASAPVIDASLAPSSTIPAGLLNTAWSGDTSQDMFDVTETSEILASGEEFSVIFDVLVDPDLLDDDSDYLTNSADVTAMGENYDGNIIQVSDQSGLDTGTGFDSDEPTNAIIPEIAVAKAAGDAIANGDNWDVPFTLVIENTGSVDLNQLSLFDDITSVLGNALVSVSGLMVQNFIGSGTAPTANTAWEADTTLDLFNSDGNLAPGDRLEVVFMTTIDPDGIDSISQVLDNQAVVSGNAVDEMGNPLTSASGIPLMADDDSDSGTSPQGTNTGENGDTGIADDPTPIIIADVAAAKEVTGSPTLLSNGNFEATYRVVIENIGTVDLANLSLTEDLSAQFGAAYVNASDLSMVTAPADADSAVTLDSANWNGGTVTEMINSTVPSKLAVGDSFVFEFTAEINESGTTLNNTVIVSGDAVDANGNPLTSSAGNPITAIDDSDSGADISGDNPAAPGDNGTSDDPTPIVLPEVADLVTVKTLASGDSTPEEGSTVTYEIEVTNDGRNPASGVSLTDLLPNTLTATLNNGTVSQGSYDPVTGVWTIGTLAVGDSALLTLEGTVNVGEGGNTITNITTAATGDQLDPGTAGDDLTETVMVDPNADLVTVKTLASGNSDPVEGEIVTFEIVVENAGAAQATNVSLTDLLPAGLTATSNNGTVSQGSYDAVTGVWTIGTLGKTASVTLTLEGTVDVGEGGNTISNITTAASGDQPDPGTAGDDLEEVVIVDPNAELVTVKSLASGDSSPEEGDTVTFQIVVENAGAAQATTVSLTDLLPAGLTATPNHGTTSQGAYNAATGVWSIGTLSNGASATLTLEGTVDIGEGGNTINNITTAAIGDQPDPGTAGDDLEAFVVVDPNADLVTVKSLTSGDSFPKEGDTVTFQIVVDNTGGAQATNVSLTDLLPAGLTATTNNGNATQGAYDAVTGIWSIGTLADGGSATLTLEGVVDIGEGGNFINNITTAASGDQPDPDTAGDDLEESVLVDPSAELITVKTLASGNNVPEEGETVSFLIVVDNAGAAQARNVTLTDVLPAGLTATANNGVVSQGTYDATSGIWTIGTLNNGDSATLTLEGTVDVGEGGNTIINVTTVADGDQPDPSTSGDDLEETITVDPNADLVTVKTLASGDSVPEEGDTVTFQIAVNNNGSALATNVTLTDLLPAGLTATANNGSTSQGLYDAVTGIWTIGSVAEGGSATLTLEGTVNVGEGGNVINNITTAASGDQPDPTTIGDDLVASVTVDPNADLLTVKTLASGNSIPEEGDTVAFQIIVENNGSAQATNVSLTDLLPAGLTATANNGTVSQGAYDAVTGIWTIGTVAVGGSATLTLEGTVNVGEGGNVINNITTAASGDQPDPTTIGDDLEASVTVDPDADLLTVKTLASGNSIPEEGDTVAFRIIVENNGSAQATNVSLTDLLPAGLTATMNNGTVSQGAYNAVTGVWTIGTLGEGGSATLTLEGTVNVGEGGNTISNVTTAASGDQPDPGTVGDDLVESIVVDPDAELVTVKTLASGNSVPEEGETVTFQIVVANTGAAQATNVLLTDLLPAGLTATVNNGFASQGSYDAVTGIWSIGTLGDGGSATLTLEGIVNVGEGGNTISNITTAASGDRPDPSTVGDDLEESVSVDPNADLVTVKTLASGNNVPAEGDTVTFQIEVQNTGAAQATNVSLTDLLPAGLTATANNGTVSQGAYDAVTGLWTTGTIANGGSATLILEGTVDVGEGGNTISNITIAASGDQPDSDTAGDDLEEIISVDPNADLVTVKTLASGNSVPAEGDIVSFQIVVDNAGTAQATNVSLTDLLPAGLTATANNGVTSQGVYDAVTGVWTIGTIANGSSAILTLEGTVDVGQGGNTINNITTAASGDQPDPGTLGDDLEASVSVDPNADLVTVKTLASGDSVPEEGDTVTFQIVVDNNGSAQATNVSLTDLLPAGLTATTNNGTASQGDYDAVTGIWTIGTIAEGDSATLTLEGIVNIGEGGNTISNITTSASGDQPDPTTIGDDLEESVTVDPNADLVTVKTLASGDSVPEEGDTVTFQIVVDNNGSAQATNVSLTDLLPTGLTATANNGIVSQGSYDGVTGIWTIGSVAEGGSATLLLEGTVNVGEGGNTISNITTAASGDQPDPTTIGDDLEASVTVDPNADLVTVKTLASGNSLPEEGETVAFQIDVENNGSAQATNVSLTDLLPAGLTATVNNGTVSQGAYDAVTGIWTIGTVAEGDSATLTLEGTVDIGGGGNVINNITTAASGDQPDPTAIGDDLEASVTVDPNADLVTVKTLASGNGLPEEGETVAFQIVVENNGSAQATNVSLTDLLPAGLTATVNNGTASQGAYDAVTGIWTIGTVAEGDSATLTLEGTVDIGEGGNVINNITTAASGVQPDPTTIGDDLEASVTVDPNADLVTVKTLASGNSLPEEGDTVTFQIVVDNSGSAQATNVSLTDLLPAGLTATAINGTASQGAYDAVTGIWTIGTVAVGGSATLVLEGTVNVGEGGNTISNITTAASGDQPDSSTVGDDLQEFISIDPDADLVTVKTLASGNSDPKEGDTVTFQIVVDNNGSAQATNVNLTDLLPSSLTATANNGTASQGAYDAVTGIWTIGTLAEGGSATLTLEGVVNVGEGGNTISNITTAANGDQPDPTMVGDDLEESVVVHPNADLVTVKTLASGNNVPEVGDTVTFQIDVDNNGTAQATNVTLTDLLPAGLTETVDNGLVSQGSYDAETGIWTIGTLANGTRATLILEGTVNIGEGGNTIVNVTTAATADQPDPNTVGDDLVESVQVSDRPTEVIATADTVETTQGTPVIVDFLANDINDGNGVLSLLGLPVLQDLSTGTLTMVGNDWVFTPAADFIGEAVISYTLQDEFGNTATSTHTVVVAGAAFVEPPTGRLVSEVVYVEAPAPREIKHSDYEREYNRNTDTADLVILNAVANLSADNLHDLQVRPLADSIEGSVGYSSGKGYRGIHSVDPTDECGRFFIDTIVRDEMLSVIARSTIDPERSSGVIGFSASLANALSLPEWVSQIADGEYLIDRTADIEVIALKLVAHRQDGSVLSRIVEIDTRTGEITEREGVTNVGARISEELRAVEFPVGEVSAKAATRQ